MLIALFTIFVFGGAISHVAVSLDVSAPPPTEPVHTTTGNPLKRTRPTNNSPGTSNPPTNHKQPSPRSCSRLHCFTGVAERRPTRLVPPYPSAARRCWRRRRTWAMAATATSRRSTAGCQRWLQTGPQ
eukprot:5309083-Prymnesium_polylepis.1